MSQFPTSGGFDLPPKTSGLAIAALVLGIVGFCIPGVGLIALILGIVALSKIGAEPARLQGRGLAITGIVTGGIGLVVSTVLVCGGIMLPALGQARQSARSLKSSIQLRQIGLGLMQYASANKEVFPEPGADWQSRIAPYGVTSDLFLAPYVDNQSVTDSYIYVPGYRLDQIRAPFQTVIAYENPSYVRNKRVNVLLADGSVQSISVDELPARLAASEPPAAPTPNSPPKRP